MKHFRVTSAVFGVILTSFLSMGCGQEGANIQSWLSSAAKFKTKAEKESPKLPYRNRQHQAFKSYFAEIEKMALTLKADKGLAAKLSGAMERSDLGKICSQIFITKDAWRDLVRGCTKNRFFLCSEEVRAYPNMVSAMKESLNGKQQKRFDQTATCRNAL